MEFYEVIKSRYSSRSYSSRSIENEKLQRILEAARLAPTAANRQSFKIIVIRTEARREELSKIYPAKWFVEAPLILCVCGIPSGNWTRRDGKNFIDVDASIVMDHIILAAAAEELGTCWIGAFDPLETRRVLGIPENVEPIVLTPLGYATDRASEKKRKKIEDLVVYDIWS